MPTPGPETIRYGGNTSCVEVRVVDEHVIALDAGTGIVRLGAAMEPDVRRVDVLLTHLHMDHIIGLGFFDALQRPDLEVHLWGPASPTLDLRERLGRYLSPPLFPVRLAEVQCDLTLHDLPYVDFEVPGLRVTAATVCHPGPTVGFRLTDDHGTLTYLPDHEPALGAQRWPDRDEWTSGFDLADGADVLIHDAQYDDDEYPEHVGWGHSTITHALAFAEQTGVEHLVAFHHDPQHDDATIDRLYAGLTNGDAPAFDLTVAAEGQTFEVRRS